MTLDVILEVETRSELVFPQHDLIIAFGTVCSQVVSLFIEQRFPFSFVSLSTVGTHLFY